MRIYEEKDLEIFAIIFGMVERNEKEGRVSLRANLKNDAQLEYVSLYCKNM